MCGLNVSLYLLELAWPLKGVDFENTGISFQRQWVGLDLGFQMPSTVPLRNSALSHPSSHRRCLPVIPKTPDLNLFRIPSLRPPYDLVRRARSTSAWTYGLLISHFSARQSLSCCHMSFSPRLLTGSLRIDMYMLLTLDVGTGLRKADPVMLPGTREHYSRPSSPPLDISCPATDDIIG